MYRNLENSTLLHLNVIAIIAERSAVGLNSHLDAVLGNIVNLSTALRQCHSCSHNVSIAVIPCGSDVLGYREWIFLFLANCWQSDAEIAPISIGSLLYHECLVVGCRLIRSGVSINLCCCFTELQGILVLISLDSDYSTLARRNSNLSACIHLMPATAVGRELAACSVHTYSNVDRSAVDCGLSNHDAIACAAALELMLRIVVISVESINDAYSTLTVGKCNGVLGEHWSESNVGSRSNLGARCVCLGAVAPSCQCATFFI